MINTSHSTSKTYEIDFDQLEPKMHMYCSYNCRQSDESRKLFLVLYVPIRKIENRHPCHEHLNVHGYIFSTGPGMFLTVSLITGTIQSILGVEVHTTMNMPTGNKYTSRIQASLLLPLRVAPSTHSNGSQLQLDGVGVEHLHVKLVFISTNANQTSKAHLTSGAIHESCLTVNPYVHRSEYRRYVGPERP